MLLCLNISGQIVFGPCENHIGGGVFIPNRNNQGGQVQPQAPPGAPHDQAAWDLDPEMRQDYLFPEEARAWAGLTQDPAQGPGEQVGAQGPKKEMK